MGACDNFEGFDDFYGSSYCVEFFGTRLNGEQERGVLTGKLSPYDLDSNIFTKSEDYGNRKELILVAKFDGQSKQIASVSSYPNAPEGVPTTDPYRVYVSVSYSNKKIHRKLLCERKRIYRRYGTINTAKVEITQEKAFFLAKIPLTKIGAWQTVQTAKQTIYFPNRRIDKITFNQVDFTTNNGEKYLGRRINLIDEDGNHFLKGFYEGEAGLSYKLPSGLFKFSSHFIASPISPITRTTVKWSNWDSDIYATPKDLEEKYVFIDGNSTVLDADQFGLYRFDKASVAEFDPSDYFTYDR